MERERCRMPGYGDAEIDFNIRFDECRTGVFYKHFDDFAPPLLHDACRFFDYAVPFECAYSRPFYLNPFR